MRARYVLSLSISLAFFPSPALVCVRSQIALNNAATVPVAGGYRRDYGRLHGCVLDVAAAPDVNVGALLRARGVSDTLRVHSEPEGRWRR